MFVAKSTPLRPTAMPFASKRSLSTFSPNVLVEAITAQDVALIAKIPGVGKKTASRIILELKGSFDVAEPTLFVQEASSGAAQEDRLKEIKAALLSMGLTSIEADVALKGAPDGADDQELLRYALKRLGSGV